jgi:hypothetical protein
MQTWLFILLLEMKMSCQHEKEKLKKIEESTFEWCSLCGSIIHHVKIGGIFKQCATGILCDFSKQRDSIIVMDQNNKRGPDHVHSWMKLTQDTNWCRDCGGLQIKRCISHGTSISYRSGVLFPHKKSG